LRDFVEKIRKQKEKVEDDGEGEEEHRPKKGRKGKRKV
jgi:hypothetical protein